MRTQTLLFTICFFTLTQVTGCGRHHPGNDATSPNIITDHTVPEVESCPTGYAKIPDHSNGSFCVMKYEAKQGSDSKPVSSEQNTPWTGTYAEEAKALCQSLGEGYDLISNDEWLTIARNLENQSQNWTGGAVGSGCLFRGNNGQPMPWNECGYGDGQGSQDYGSNRNERAKFTLSNGEVLWDFAGNVSEWVDWTKGGVFDAAPVGCQQVATEFPNIPQDTNCPLVAADYSPVDSTLDSAKGAGKFVGGMGGYARRGGASWSGDFSGIYALGLERGGANNDHDNGFRCVYRF